MKRRRDSGFTLIEVLVALAIAAGSLILVLSANGASLRRSAEARLAERLERSAESKLAEWLSGAERAAEGDLPGFDRHRWEMRAVPEPLAGLRRLRRVTLRIYGPGGGAPAFERAVVRYGAGEGP